MAATVQEFRGYRIAIYSPLRHFPVITPPGSNRIIEFGERRARSTIVEGALVCLDRAEALIETLLEADRSTVASTT